MKFIAGVIVGGVLGAGLAMLFSPWSGEELRQNIQEQVDVQSSRMQEMWQPRYEQLQNQVKKLSGDIQKLTDRSKETSPSD